MTTYYVFATIFTLLLLAIKSIILKFIENLNQKLLVCEKRETICFWILTVFATVPCDNKNRLVLFLDYKSTKLFCNFFHILFTNFVGHSLDFCSFKRFNHWFYFILIELVNFYIEFRCFISNLHLPKIYLPRHLMDLYIELKPNFEVRHCWHD